MLLGKTARTIGTYRSSKQVTIIITIRHTAHEREQRPVRLVSVHGRLQQTVAQLLGRLGDETLNGTGHELVGIRLHRRSDHGREIMLVVKGLDK